MHAITVNDAHHPRQADIAARRERIEQSLRQLPLADPAIAAVTGYLVDGFFIRRGRCSVESSFFAIRDKVVAVVDHFAPHGLTLIDYLRAAARQPQLFAMAPRTIQSNIEGVVGHFARDGLTVSDYLRIALKEPALFYRAPDSVIANVQRVTDHFARDGLSIAGYLHAGLRQPRLFTQSSASIISNVETMSSHFRPHGLTVKDYVSAALIQPALFVQTPARLLANIEAVVDHFARDGLTLPAYLQAALKQPQLFTQAPSTIIRHINTIIDMQRHDLIAVPRQAYAPPQHPLQPLFAFLIRAPRLICLSDDNYALRVNYVSVTGDRPPGAALLTRSRHRIETDLARFITQRRRPLTSRVIADAETCDLPP